MVKKKSICKIECWRSLGKHVSGYLGTVPKGGHTATELSSNVRTEIQKNSVRAFDSTIMNARNFA